MVTSLRDVEASGWVFLKRFDHQNVRPVTFHGVGLKAF